ncbi:MAG: DNA mismatch repair protein MutS, partial [Mogibacterium sp.]|nr:DNA mismatch repair protein MutS [Mogibacterium sp.]
MAQPKLSPMMQQYFNIKEDYKDTILMFRLGDFYEMFYDDALTASRELELTLTGRNCGLEERAPMCGVPHHAVDSYIVRLVKNGHKVAICEQMEDPAAAKGIVKREITRVYTPGTLDLSDVGSTDDNIYIASVCIGEAVTALAVADISTGELSVTEFEDDDEHSGLINELAVTGARELMISEDHSEGIKRIISDHMPAPYIDAVDSSYYREASCREIVMKHFGVTSLVPLDLDGKEEMTAAVGALLMYLIDTQKSEPEQIRDLIIKRRGQTMQLDRSTMRNLELMETVYDHELKGSLLGVLGRTRTAMGGRLLKQWLREPLKDPEMINRRLDAVEDIRNNPACANNIGSNLKNVYDFQRLTARVATGRADGRDLIALKKTIGKLPEIREQLSYLVSSMIKDIERDIDDFDELYNMIDRAIEEEPPHTITEGGLIRRGYSHDLDELKGSIADAKDWIAGLEASEKERTGIKTLKVGYNKVFGYYIDVSKGMADKVPEDYIRKQTLVNKERFVTPELKEKEDIVFSAETKINKLEYEEFCRIRNAVEPYIDALQRASSAVAALDVLLSFARVSSENNYVRPVVNGGSVIDIKRGRHPAVEQLMGAGLFVSNDAYIDMSDRSMLIITGPNMSGKSTYMRQTAVIVLMAQIGCFVPADHAEIGVVDRIFTRIGASDNLSYGQSTFYIEMSELAGILRNATERSLIILDEIGRGTSTFDGLSIAWATVEYLSDPHHRVRTMFATHYHELTELAEICDGVHNLSVAVSEEGSNIVFLHNIVDGPASKSYGIHVARIAGVPEEIRKSARIKLRELESGEISASRSQDRASEGSGINQQLSFLPEGFSMNDVRESEERYAGYEHVISRIRDIDINVMTPLAALNTLQDIIDEVRDA